MKKDPLFSEQEIIYIAEQLGWKKVIIDYQLIVPEHILEEFIEFIPLAEAYCHNLLPDSIVEEFMFLIIDQMEGISKIQYLQGIRRLPRY